MMRKSFRIPGPDELREICRAANRYESIDIDAMVGSYTVDCKSPMGVMGLGAGKTVTIVIHTDNEEIADEFFEMIEGVVNGKEQAV